jgi:serine carboxypeptidase-like clade 2
MARPTALVLLLLLASPATAVVARGLSAAPSSADASSASRRGHVSLARGYTPAALADAVDPTTLPGISPPSRPLDFPLFGGFIRVDPAGEADGTSANDPENGRALYYVLAESADKPDKPEALILWLNGGPGCSSVGGGFLSEQGPFFPRRLSPDPAPSSNADNTTTTPRFALDRNPHAWNRGGTNASVIFLESPAYVGFSYSNTTLDATVGDVRTAQDAATFLRRFVERFPKYKGVPLYVSGESYAGHYVPTLAAEILRVNKIVEEEEAEKRGGNATAAAAANDDASTVAAPSTSLPLKGFLLGNPWTDATVDNTGALDYWYAHAMISREAHEEVARACDMSTAGPLALRSKRAPQSSALAFFFRATGTTNKEEGETTTAAGSASEGREGAATTAAATENDEEACDDALGRAWREMGRINIYSIYKPVCREPGAAYEGMDDDEAEEGGPFAEDDLSTAAAPSSSSSPPRSPMASQPAHDSRQSTPNDRPAPAPGGRDRKRRYDPCIGDEVEAFLNDARVQGALHADPALGAIPGGSRGPDPESGRPGWSDCTGRIDYSRDDLLTSMLPLYARLVGARGAEVREASGGAAVSAEEKQDTSKTTAEEAEPGGRAGQWAADALAAVKAGKATKEQRIRAGWLQAAAQSALRMWVYSGDTDGIVPVLGTRRWVEGMQLPVSRGWRAWKDGDGQVGGRRVDYSSPRGAKNAAVSSSSGAADAAGPSPLSFPTLSFLTARGAGHMVPYDTPQRSQQLLVDFLREGGTGVGRARGDKANKAGWGAAAAAGPSSAAAAPSSPAATAAASQAAVKQQPEQQQQQERQV